MANPYLPSWEYIPDGEPRVFGDRVYVYGSHDRVDCERFCDYKLKVWSASVHDLSLGHATEIFSDQRQKRAKQRIHLGQNMNYMHRTL